MRHSQKFCLNFIETIHIPANVSRKASELSLVKVVKAGKSAVQSLRESQRNMSVIYVEPNQASMMGI